MKEKEEDLDSKFHKTLMGEMLDFVKGKLDLEKAKFVKPIPVKCIPRDQVSIQTPEHIKEFSEKKFFEHWFLDVKRDRAEDE